MLKYDFIEINDFRVIFWQKLANLYDVICAIDYMIVCKNRQKEAAKWSYPITNVSLESSQ